MKVAIVAQRDNDRTAGLAADLRERLAGVTVWLDAATAGRLGLDGRPVEELHPADLVVSIEIGDDPIRTVGPPSDFFDAIEKLD